jgi:NOL1/NOP2/fmu family ribosome biogenesis protein
MRIKTERVEEVWMLLKEQFGIEELPFKLEERGKGRFYAFTCDFEGSHHRGIYFGTLERGGFRLSIDGAALAGKLATKNVVEVGDREAERWMRGEDIEAEDVGEVRGYVLLKWRNFFIGCGRGDGKKIKNFVAKNRRIS